jgi:hypothetical protein
MAEPTRAVLDLVPLVAETIKERLELLGEIQKTEAQTGQINKQAARERRELLSLALRAIEMYMTAGMGAKHVR